MHADNGTTTSSSSSNAELLASPKRLHTGRMNHTTQPQNATEPDVVLTIEEVAKLLKVSAWTIRALERAKAFPIPRLPRLDRKPRYSAALVRKFAAGQLQPKER